MSSKSRASFPNKGNTARTAPVPSTQITIQDVTNWLNWACSRMHDQAVWHTNDLNAVEFATREQYAEALECARRMADISGTLDNMLLALLHIRAEINEYRSDFNSFDENGEPDLAPECRKFLG